MTVVSQLFGEPSVKIEEGSGNPTCWMKWQDGVLLQLFTYEDTYQHYLGDHYCHTTHHRREAWVPVPGLETKEPQ